MIACVLDSNAPVNSPMKLIATFRCGVWRGGGLLKETVPSAATRPLPLIQPLSCLTPPLCLFPLAPLSSPSPSSSFHPSAASHAALGIELELAKSPDMLITGAGIVVMCLTLTCEGLIQVDGAEQAPRLTHIHIHSTDTRRVYQSEIEEENKQQALRPRSGRV